MIIKSITLKTFKCFENYSVSFEKINLIEGAIGIGKSTILQALIFALYGYYEGTLSDLPTKGKAESCRVGAVIEDNGHLIEVIREFPLKLVIKEDGKTLKLSTAEGNSYLNDRFGSRQIMMQFRVLDAYNSEANFLAEGNVTLKKILFAGTDEMFNSIRNNLNAIKLERERYNKDSTVVYKHYPSEKRLEILKKGYDQNSNEYILAENQVGEITKETNNKIQKITKNQSNVGANKQTIERLQKQIDNVDTIKSSFDNKLLQSESRHTEIQRTVGELNKQFVEIQKNTEIIKQNKVCYVCKQSILDTSNIIIEQKLKEQKLQKQIKDIRNEDIELCSKIPEYKDAIVKERLQKIEEFKTEIKKLEQENIDCEEDNSTLAIDLEMNKDNTQNLLKIRDNSRTKREILNTFIIKLEGRLKQKEYIYTERDIIIVKKAIEELDKLSSVYLVETVHSLEPIINSVLEKIGFAVTFDVYTKGKFNILLEREGVQYKYKDLSCGQRLILQIALKIALLLQQNKTGLMMSDEGLSALENDNLEDIINLFKDLQFQLVFVLHRANIEDPEINIIKLGGNDEKEIT